MPLEIYRKKRNFRQTPEPAGKSRSRRSKAIFLVQKHDASRLHYDFRLAIEGVLVSWALPKGPTLDPAMRRLAARTEDHPIEYADFEGTIPEGEYGAGTVMLWDRGTYETEGELTAVEQVARGEIKFLLQGKKLRGAFVLIHTGRNADKPRDRGRWLLLKRRDRAAVPSWNPEDSKLGRSVLTGRTLEEIARGRPGRKRAA